MKTSVAKKESYEKKWFHIDATDLPLGRLAAGVATILMGKHRPTYTAHVDTGDFVVITNVEKIGLSGKKREQKEYVSFSGYPGGLKTTPIRRILENKPEFVIHEAVRRMLPKTKLGRVMLKKLKLFVGPKHEHAAQGPVTIDYKGQVSAYLAAKDN